MQKLNRRHVLTTLGASTVLLCPAIVNAAIDVPWSPDAATDTPLGVDRILSLPAGPAEVDVSELQPGEVAVVARPSDSDDYSRTGMTQYIAVMRRTDSQIAFGQANDRPGTVQDVRYLVVDLVCPHRGKAVGFTGDPETPFACTDLGRRHSSQFNTAGLGNSGASEGDWMSVPAYTISVGAKTVVSLA